ncbi:SLATT domain-containing protein [Aliidiomarina sp. Khilg15.8]
MNKNDLLKNIADKSYDVGFGAKKHFATYDIVEKAPGLIGFTAMAFGIFALVVDGLSTELTSAIFIVLGLVGLYINFYDHQKQDYASTGTELTKLYNDLKVLYFRVKALDDSTDCTSYQEELSELEQRFYENCINKQILFSNWFAHYKFFWEHQIEWVDEQKNFTFWRDKIPLSLTVSVVVTIIIAISSFSPLMTKACSFVGEYSVWNSTIEPDTEVAPETEAK